MSSPITLKVDISKADSIYDLQEEMLTVLLNNNFALDEKHLILTTDAIKRFLITKGVYAVKQEGGFASAFLAADGTQLELMFVSGR